MDLIDRLWTDAEPMLFISRDEFIQQMEGWAITPLSIDGEVAFVGLSKGERFHCHSFRTGHRITRKMLHDFIDPIIAEHGYAETRTPKDDERQRRFNLAFGFEQVGEDEFDVIYRITRRAKCQ